MLLAAQRFERIELRGYDLEGHLWSFGTYDPKSSSR